MYNVLRFFSDDVDLLKEVAGKLNEVRSDFYDGMNRAGDGFSCSVCDADSWEEHLSAMRETLAGFSPVLAFAREKGVEMEFDVAIDKEDVEGRFYTSFDLPLDLLRQLAEAGVAYMVTCYYVTDSEEENEA